MAKPCKFCMGLLAVYQPKEIFYSTNEGGFAKL